MVYGPFVLAVSLVTLGFWLVALVNAIHAYRVYHDDRAALLLAGIIGATVTDIGLAISAASVTVTGESGPGTAFGLGISRGALLTTGIILAVGSTWRGSRRND